MTITSATPRDRPIPDHLCTVCRILCGYGIGFDEKAVWYCINHVPADFFSSVRKAMKEAIIAQDEALSSTPQAISKPPIAPSSLPQGDLFGSF